MRNLGDTGLRHKRRNADPMKAYDALPGPLRQWLANASLPWSPHSAYRLWRKAHARGMPVEERLRFLDRCEAGALRRARSSGAAH